SEEHTSELQSPDHLVCRLLLEKKKKPMNTALVQQTEISVVVPFFNNFATLDDLLDRLIAVLAARVCTFFFNDTATTEIYTLSLHDALPISCASPSALPWAMPRVSAMRSSSRR